VSVDEKSPIPTGVRTVIWSAQISLAS